MQDLKIDIVYLWVNDSDEAWRKKRDSFLPKADILESDSVSNYRYIDNDELKFSLRSVEKYAPWINHIYIVTDNQVPKWLDVNNPKITVVDHKEIFDNEDLPVFNSMAIEANLSKIPNLSEHFLFANDDMFFYRQVEKNLFYKDSQAIYRFQVPIRKKKRTKLYGVNIYYGYNLILQKKGKSTPFFSHHNIDAYTKSDFNNCINEFSEEFAKVSKMRFRDFNSIERTAIAQLAVVNGTGIFKHVRKCRFYDVILKKLGFNIQFDSMYFGLHKKNVARMLDLFKPYMFCVNDNYKATIEDRTKFHNMLENLYPDKSEFEI